MTWINGLLEDDKVFPSEIGVPFPPNFRDIAYRIMRRLFRIYAHIYCKHLQVNMPIINISHILYLNSGCKKYGDGAPPKYIFQTFYIFRSRVSNSSTVRA